MMMVARSVVAASIVLAFATGCAGRSLSAHAPETTGASVAQIDWQPFSPEVFARAKREGKLVLVDAGIEGCTACRWMHEGTYRNRDIIGAVAKDFIAVSVDADTQPDL